VIDRCGGREVLESSDIRDGKGSACFTGERADMSYVREALN
jgi:hypothetical protein